MDDQSHPKDATNPFDQFYDEDDPQSEQNPPREAPAHMNATRPEPPAQPQQPTQQQQPVEPTSPNTNSGPSPAIRPGEDIPAQPIHHNVQQQSADTPADPQAAINQAIMEQADETGEELETFTPPNQEPTPPTQPTTSATPKSPTPPQQTQQSPSTTPQQQIPPQSKPTQPQVTPENEQQPPNQIFKTPENQDERPMPSIDDHGMPPSRRAMTVRKIIFGFILFLVMTGLGVLGAMAISGEFGEPPEILDNIIQYVPFGGKSKSQVFASIFSEETQISSYDYDMSASFNIESQSFGDTQSGKVDLDITGSMFLDDNDVPSEYSTDVDLKTSVSPLSGDISVKTVSTENTIYLQLETLSGAFSSYGQMLPPTGEWFMVDLEPLNTQARDALEGYGQDVEENKTATEYTQEELEQVFNKLEQIDDVEDTIELHGTETLSDGTKAYHLTFTPTTDVLVDVASTLFSENSDQLTPEEETALRDVMDNFETLSFDLWANTDTYFIHKLQTTFTYVVDSQDFDPIVWQEATPLVAGASQVLADQDVNDTVSGAIVIEYSNLNNATPLNIPQNATSVDEYYAELGGLFSQSFDNPAEQQIQARNASTKADIRSVGTALEAYASQNGGTYPETLGGLVDTFYFNYIPVPESARNLYCDTQYNYLRAPSEDNAVVWVDLEPCYPDQTLDTYYIYRTSCSTATETIGTPPTTETIADTSSC